MLDDGSGNYENTEELGSGDSDVESVSVESDSSGTELLSDGDAGQEQTANQAFTLITISDMNLGEYAGIGMIAAGVGCMMSIGILALLKILRASV